MSKKKKHAKSPPSIDDLDDENIAADAAATAIAVAEPPEVEEDTGKKDPVTIAQAVEMIDALRGEVEAVKSKGGMRPPTDHLRRTIGQQEATEFLDTPHPIDEFWSMNPYQFYALFSGGDTINKINGDKKVMPPLIMTFNEWHGAGSEFPNPAHPSRIIRMGRCLIHEKFEIGITEEEIERFRLPPGTKTKEGVIDANGNSYYPLTRVVEKIVNHHEFQTILLPARTLVEMIRVKYDLRQAEVDRKARYEAEYATMRAGREKTGHLEILEALGV